MDHLRRSWTDNKAEIYTIVRLSTPVSTGFLLNKLVSFVSVIMVGHLGPAELAAAALGSSLINVSGNSVLAGLAGAMSTLCGQVHLHAKLPANTLYTILNKAHWSVPSTNGTLRHHITFISLH